MPILNLEKRGLGAGGKAGNIRKGIKTPVIKDGKPVKRDGQIITRPEEVPYFVFKPDSAIAGIEEQIKTLYGPQPKSIAAFLASNDKDRAWDYWYECHTFNQMIARSDGALVTFLFDTVTNQRIISYGKIIEMPQREGTACYELIQGNSLNVGDMLGYTEGMVLAHNSKGEPMLFSPKGRLNIVLKDLRRKLTWTVHTGGIRDVTHITQMVLDMEGMAKYITEGMHVPVSLAMIPFTLTRVEVERSYQGDDGKPHKRVGWDILMEVEPEFFSGYLAALASTQMALSVTNPALPELPDEFIDSEETFDEEVPPEFEPDQSEGQELGSLEELKRQAAQAREARRRDTTARPWTPEYLKDWFARQVTHHTKIGTQVEKTKVQVVAAQLTKMYGNDTDRYTLIRWLTDRNAGSAKLLSGAEIQTLLDWLGVDDFGSLPEVNVRTEAVSALQLANATLGQQKLEF